MLLALFVFLHFIGALRERPGRVAYVGALTGMVAMTMAFVTLLRRAPTGRTSTLR